MCTRIISCHTTTGRQRHEPPACPTVTFSCIGRFERARGDGLRFHCVISQSCVSVSALPPLYSFGRAWPYLDHECCGVRDSSQSGCSGSRKGGGRGGRERVRRKRAGLSGWGFQGAGPTEPARVWKWMVCRLSSRQEWTLNSAEATSISRHGRGWLKSKPRT